jgi:hypothetical protein
VPRKLTRTMGAASLVLVLACSGVACGNSDDAPIRRGETSTQSREQPEGRAATGWRAAVPAAYLLAPATREARQRGIRLSAHWLSRNGTVTDTDPRGKVVVWPAPMRIAATPATAFHIAIAQQPDRVDVRTFAGGVDAAGVPLEPPQLVACSQNTRDRDCRFAVRDRGVDVLLLKHSGAPITRFVLYARWYVPLAQRPPSARSNPTVSASWGFVAAHPVHRRAAPR